MLKNQFNHFSQKEIGQCSLCKSIIYDNDNFVVYNGDLFCTESCKNEAIDNSIEF